MTETHINKEITDITNNNAPPSDVAASATSTDSNDNAELSGTSRYGKLIPLFFWSGMLFYVFVITKAAGGVIPLCIFHAITGFDCPGCGMTRSSTLFVKGHLIQSLSYHPGGIFFVTWLTAVTVFQTSEFILARNIKLPPLLKTLYSHFTNIALWVTFLYGASRLVLELTGVIPRLPNH